MTGRASSWRDRAACVGRVDIDWFPSVDRPGGTTKAFRDNIARAREVCASCPVKAECLAEARADPLTAGIWGGTTETQRRGGPRQPAWRPLKARCGTEAGYFAHLRQTHTQPCVACKEAHALTERLRRMRLAVVR